MWIFMSDAMLSIVADRNNPKRLLVRARKEIDIKRVFGSSVKVKRTPKADYAFRVSLDRGIVLEQIGEHLANIEYDNFKDSVSKGDRARHNAYLRCWYAMRDFQDDSFPRSELFGSGI